LMWPGNKNWNTTTKKINNLHTSRKVQMH
jgi:hypothetical protein